MKKYQRYERALGSFISICLCLLSIEFAVGQEQSSKGICETYIVNPGDSALSIAQKFGLDYENFVSALKECAGYVEGNVLQIGQKVCVPPYSSSCQFVASIGEDDTCKYYTVQYGDTLSIISNLFNMEVAEFAALNGFNLTNTVKPMMKLALPPWDESCPRDILSKPVQEAPLADCRVYISNGGESLADIASKVSLRESDLLFYNAEYQSAQQTEPGAQIKLSPWTESCENNVVVINRPVSSESVEISTGATSPQAAAGSDLILAPSIAPEPIEKEEDPTPGQFDDLGRVVVDLYLEGISSKDFSEGEYLFRKNLALASGVPISHIDVRFFLLVESDPNRKLLKENLLQANTAIYGDEMEIYKNLNQSVQSGGFLKYMTEDNFKIVSVAVMQPQEAILYDARSVANTTEDGNSLPLPLGALVGIAAGVAVLLIISVVLCCVKISQKRKKVLEDAKEEKTTNQGNHQSSKQVKRKGQPVLSERKEFNLSAFSTISDTRSTMHVPISHEGATRDRQFSSFSQGSRGDCLPPSAFGGVDVSPRSFVSSPGRHVHDAKPSVEIYIEPSRVETDGKSRSSRPHSGKKAGSQSPQKFNKPKLSNYIES